jgi:hypothetical protein
MRLECVFLPSRVVVGMARRHSTRYSKYNGNGIGLEDMFCALIQKPEEE